MPSLSCPALPATRRRLVLLAAVFATAGIVGLIARVLDAGRWWTLGIVAFSPYLLLGAPVALALTLAARYWPGAAVAVLLLAACVVVDGRLYLAATAPHDARRLTVMTSNLHLGTADAGDVVALVRRHHVQLLMLEELTPSEQHRLIAAGLDTALPFHISTPGPNAQGTGLWSRYPLTGKRELEGFTFAFVTARMQVPGLRAQPIVAALHLAGPVPVATDWLADVNRLPHVLHTLPGTAPVLVGGDFNATPDTAQFRAVLTGGFHDAAQQSGSGITRTYPANRWFPPLIAIDHVLTRGATARSVDTLQVSGSDHRALLVSVALPAST